jgi:hypothetical protein
MYGVERSLRLLSRIKRDWIQQKRFCIKRVFAIFEKKETLMRYTLVILFLLFISAKSFAQAADERYEYQKKLEKYSRMKRTGQTLVVLGSVLSIAGFVIMSNATQTTTYSGYGSPQTTTEGNPVAGAAAYLVGSACVGAGVPLWIVGGVQKGKYERKLNELSVGASVSPQGAGLTIRFRF